MKLFNKVAIVGVGLIGGSIALAVKKRGIANEVIGVSRRQKTLLLAKKIRAINRGSNDLNIIKEADLVILAAAVSTILELAPQISRIIKKDCVVTDVGSTKKEIVSKLESIFANYVGSHPLAGSEKKGVVNAQADLFKDSLCILTPTKNTNKVVLRKIKKFWEQMGAKVTFLTPPLHDKALSYVSHLPHVVAFSLSSTVPKKYLRFGSSSLRDTTRIAASDARLWCDVFLSNQNMIKAIESFQKNLSNIKSAINRKDKRLLSKILEGAREKRVILNKNDRSG